MNFNKSILWFIHAYLCVSIKSTGVGQNEQFLTILLNVSLFIELQNYDQDIDYEAKCLAPWTKQSTLVS